MDIESFDKPSKAREILLFAASTAIIAGLVYFSGVEKFISAISSANLYYLFPALLLGVSRYFIFGFTWYRVFPKTGISLTYRKAFKLHMAGSFLNDITPLGQAGGEPLMAYIVSKNTGSPYEEAFSSVLSADILNIIPPFTFVFGGAIYVLFFHSLTGFILQAVYMAAIAFIVGGILVYVLWFEVGKIEAIIMGVIKKIVEITGRGRYMAKKIEEKIQAFEKSTAKLGKDPLYLLKTIIIIHTTFILEVLTLGFVMKSLGTSPLLSYLYFVLPLADFANFSPTPGGSGTYEAAMAGIIVLLASKTGFIGGNIEFAAALSVGILYRLMTYWPGLLIGYYSFNTVENGV